MSKTNLFVYGTLKRGGRSSHLLTGQDFLAEAETLPFYRLYDNGAHPCLVEDRQHGVSVQGEIWRVDDAMLVGLDAYEGVPSLFLRAEIKVAAQDTPVVAYLYRGDVSALKDCGSSWKKGDAAD